MGVWNGRIFFSFFEAVTPEIWNSWHGPAEWVAGDMGSEREQKGKLERDRLRGKVNSFAKGTTLVIKFHAKSPVHHALSFASPLNMHGFILHERAQCLHTRRHAPFAGEKKRWRGNIQLFALMWAIGKAFFSSGPTCPHILSSIVISNHYWANFFRATWVLYSLFMYCVYTTRRRMAMRDHHALKQQEHQTSARCRSNRSVLQYVFMCCHGTLPNTPLCNFWSSIWFLTQSNLPL